MLKKWRLKFCCLLAIAVFSGIAWSLPGNNTKPLYNNEYGIDFYPAYPPTVGEKIILRLRTLKPAARVTLYSDREKEIPMSFKKGYWWGEFDIPDDYKTGGHFFTVWIKYAFPPFSKEPVDPVGRFISGAGGGNQPQDSFWSKSIVWYQMVAAGSPEASAEASTLQSEEVFAGDAEEEPLPIVTGEAYSMTVPSVESSSFIIKGSKILSFTARSLEGSKEGFIPGSAREESLRLSLSGKTDGTEITASLISTNTTGDTQIGQREDKISVLVKRGKLEAYLGDFTADFTDTEFSRLNKTLSGATLAGEYGIFGFKALYSSPKGEAKIFKSYGNGTQGPYPLGLAPVVVDSEKVYVDGVLQKRGDDYTVDYQAGTITFKKTGIDPKSVLNIYYDFRQTVYAHSTYGLRLTAQPQANLKLGMTYLNDSDELSGALQTRQNMQTAPIDPKGHYIVGADGSLVSEIVSANGEVAYSRQNNNLLSAGCEESGKAVRLEISSQLGPIGITGHGKRVGPKFFPIADPDPKVDVTDFGMGASLLLGGLLGARGEYGYNKYTQSGVVYEKYLKNAKAQMTPAELPSLEYNFSEIGDSNDPVSGSLIRRVITRNSAETIIRKGFMSSSLKLTAENWENSVPSVEATRYQRVNFGIATIGLEKISFASNLEYEKREEPSGQYPRRKTLNLNLSISPAKEYFISSTLQYLDDSKTGVTNVADLSYRAEPFGGFKTDGKYSITTVNENIATIETVAKHSGSFSFDFRPVKILKAKYLYKPNFTKVLRADAISFNNLQQQAEISLAPLDMLSLGVIRKTGSSFNVFEQDFSLKKNTAETDSQLYSIKMAPFRIFSTEFDYFLENGATTQMVSGEPVAYQSGKSRGETFDAVIKTSLSETFAIDSRYTLQKTFAGSGEAEKNAANSISHTASLKGVWNVSESLSVSLSGAYTKTANYLAADPTAYTLAPGAGFVFRQGERLRIDFDYLYSKSHAGAETEKTKYSLRGKYGISDYVNIILRVEREESHLPDYRLNDISGNIEINL